MKQPYTINQFHNGDYGIQRGHLFELHEGIKDRVQIVLESHKLCLEMIYIHNNTTCEPLNDVLESLFNKNKTDV